MTGCYRLSITHVQTRWRAYQVWLIDITEHHIDEGKLNLCAINKRVHQQHRWLRPGLADEGVVGGIAAPLADYIGP
jgi:hypothetical protein